MGEFLDPPLGIYCCGHVFRQERPVLLVVREEGDWQFLCGDVDHPDANEPFHIGVGHLVAHDPSLDDAADLLPNWEAERKSLGSAWLRTPCDAKDA